MASSLPTASTWLALPLKNTPKCLWARLSSSGRKVVVMNWAPAACWQITLAMARLQGGVRTS